MQKITLPNGNTITCGDSLQDKIDALNMNGITYIPTSEEIAAEERGANARASAKAIPEWASWSEAQALTWIQTNIGTPLTTGKANLPATLTLVTARKAIVDIISILEKILVVLISISRMVIALRNAQWKDLQDR
jgi:hypothetical protein